MDGKDHTHIQRDVGVQRCRALMMRRSRLDGSARDCFVFLCSFTRKQCESGNKGKRLWIIGRAQVLEQKIFVLHPKMMRGSSWHQDPQMISMCVVQQQRKNVFFFFFSILFHFCFVCDDEPVTQRHYPRYFLLLFFYILYSPDPVVMI